MATKWQHGGESAFCNGLTQSRIPLPRRFPPGLVPGLVPGHRDTAVKKSAMDPMHAEPMPSGAGWSGHVNLHVW